MFVQIAKFLKLERYVVAHVPRGGADRAALVTGEAANDSDTPTLRPVPRNR